jgi:hypothetical protein
MESPPDDAPRGLDGIRELASRESADIILAAAARIERLIAEAEAELRVLKGTIDAAAEPGTDRPAPAARTDDRARVLPVSAAALRALDDARHALDRLAGDVAASSAATTRFRVRTGPVLLGAAGLLLVAGSLGIATGWLSLSPSANRHASVRQDGGEVRSAPSSAASAAGEEEDGIEVSGVHAEDELRHRAVTWLRAYMSGRATAGTGGLASPVIRDERAPSERVTIAESRRAITPARVDVFGDAAVLSASVTERTPEGRELVSLVSQLWTRKDGRWHLDDVRIVSAAGAEQAFRR